MVVTMDAAAPVCVPSITYHTLLSLSLSFLDTRTLCTEHQVGWCNICPAVCSSLHIEMIPYAEMGAAVLRQPILVMSLLLRCITGKIRCVLYKTLGERQLNCHAVPTCNITKLLQKQLFFNVK